MIFETLFGYLRDLLIWIASLLPDWTLTNSAFFSGMANVWANAYTWSGVIPVGIVLTLFQTAFALLFVVLAYMAIMLVANLVRGSGA